MLYKFVLERKKGDGFIFGHRDPRCLASLSRKSLLLVMPNDAESSDTEFEPINQHR